MTVWSSYLAGALAWFIATGAGVGSMQGGDPARAPKDERLRTLSALASHRLEATSAQIADCLRSALTDPDAEIRAQGLAVIAGRAGRVRFDRSRSAVQAWSRDRPTLLTFRPLALRALADGNERVRRAAVVALGNLEYEPSPSPQVSGITLNEELLREFDAQYRSDPSELVRAEIVKDVALTRTQSTVRSQLLVDALKDRSTQVVQYALMGIGEGHVAEGLPDLVRLLKHSNRVLRMNAAEAIAENGPEAGAYINDLRAALSLETDPLVAKTLQGAIDALSQTTR